MDRRVQWMAAVGVLLGGWAGAMAQESPTVLLARDLGGAGRVRLRLHAGDYEVRLSPDREVRVKESRSAGWSGGQTKTHVTVKAGQVTVEVEPPSHVNNSQVHLVIEVPACDQLTVGLSAGELQMKEAPCVQSSIDVTAGELIVNLGDGSAFGEVKGSVTIGDVNAAEFAPGAAADHGGFFPSYVWKGPGSRRLVAHVGTGEIELRH